MSTNKKQNQFILVISGVGGAGKDSVMDALRSNPEKYIFFPSYTDKPSRPDEVAGKTYNFITKEEFSEWVDKGEFIEWEKTRGEYRYGRRRDELEKVLDSGKIPVLQMDVKGVAKFKKLGYDIVSVFIVPPSLQEAEARLRKRGDSEDQIKIRLERAKLEMSYKDKYDHTIVNDDLAKAQNELLSIVQKEAEKRKKKIRLKDILRRFGMLFATFFLLGSGLIYAYHQNTVKPLTESVSVTNSSASSLASSSSSSIAVVKSPPPAEVKKNIKKSPPKYSAPSQSVTSTSTNSDGSKSVVVSTGGTAGTFDSGTLSSISVSAPSDIVYEDATGAHPELGAILKNYLASSLKYKSEISSMKKIILQDAGATGWSGQYLGQYSITADGSRITGATGYIVLNSYYYNGSPYFNDYMKLILSHEYGHHYTLYHKWVDWNLPVGTRFPDSYYSTRPLSKSTTATDYSLGWGNCEAEIIAEDYSYLYSGYGYSGVAATYGYPAASLSGWFDHIGEASLLSVPANNAPVLVSLSPVAGAVLSGSVSLSAEATDDTAVVGVEFYVDSTKIATDTTSPYSASLDTRSFANGTHTIRAVASDGTLTTEKSAAVTFQNDQADTTNPTVSFVAPAENPYNWTHDNLTFEIRSADNIGIAKVELYIDDQLALTSTDADFSAAWKWNNADAGTYTIKAKAYDAAGNTSEATIQVIKAS